MTDWFKRVLQKKNESGLTWDQIAKKGHIRLGTWMTGIPTSKPSDEELKRLAMVFDTTFEFLKYGKEDF